MIATMEGSIVRTETCNISIMKNGESYGYIPGTFDDHKEAWKYIQYSLEKQFPHLITNGYDLEIIQTITSTRKIILSTLKPKENNEKNIWITNVPKQKSN